MGVFQSAMLVYWSLYILLSGWAPGRVKSVENAMAQRQILALSTTTKPFRYLSVSTNGKNVRRFKEGKH